MIHYFKGLVLVATMVAVSVVGWAADASDLPCPTPKASPPDSHVRSKCVPARPPVRDISAQPTPSPAPNAPQQTFVFCSPAPAVGSAAPPDARVGSPPTEAKPAGGKKAEDSKVTKIDLKLTKDIGLAVESSSAFVILLVFLLVLAALGLGIALNGRTGKVGKVGKVLSYASIAMVFVCGGLIGYLLKSDVRTTLSTAQVETLAKLPQFQRALDGIAASEEEKSRLRTRVSDLERDLTAAKTKVADKVDCPTRVSPAGEILTIAFAILFGAAAGCALAYRTSIRIARLETVLAGVSAALQRPWAFRQSAAVQPTESATSATESTRESGSQWEKFAIEIAIRIIESAEQD